ncbi:MAG: DUF106 domain-containing protein [Candidatus Altiarchaeales archaeon]|nr:DUF106 domain-containing protein [Candidatus Altiarchaeales archaeon]MBD3417325.1 DUF106 domain-containing protein [Candidatus Altiarchaeales archaeon]
MILLGVFIPVLQFLFYREVDSLIIHLTHAGQAITLISFAIASLRTLVRFKFTDIPKLTENKEKIKAHQERMKDAQKKKDYEAVQRHQREMMSASMEQMKHSMKPMIYSMLPYLVIFGWLKTHFAQTGIVATIFGFSLGWLGWYILCSMITSMAVQRVIHTARTNKT